MKIGKTQYFIALHYSYLMQGINVLGFFKLVFYGGLGVNVVSANMVGTMLWSISYSILCYFLGMIWYKKKMPQAVNEVQNLRNLLAHQLRKQMRRKKIR